MSQKTKPSKKECFDLYMEYKNDCESIIGQSYIELLGAEFLHIPKAKFNELLEKTKVAFALAKKCRNKRVRHSQACYDTIDIGHVAEIARAEHFVKLYNLRLRQLQTNIARERNMLGEAILTGLDIALQINRGMRDSDIPSPKKTPRTPRPSSPMAADNRSYIRGLAKRLGLHDVPIIKKSSGTMSDLVKEMLKMAVVQFSPRAAAYRTISPKNDYKLPEVKRQPAVKKLNPAAAEFRPSKK